MRKIVFNIVLLICVFCLVSCDTNMTSLPHEMPEDFFIYINIWL